jgi:RNA polymerase sigma-70 factor, ECF subfamily
VSDRQLTTPAAREASKSQGYQSLINETLAAQPGRIGFRTRHSFDESADARRKAQLAVERAKQGDQDALRFLYVTYSDNVYGYVCSIVRDLHAAEDVTQQVFAKLITVISKYDDRGVPFFAWLLRLARNVSIDHLRANRLTPTESVLDSTADAGADPDRVMTVRAALATLPEEQREVLILRHLVGLTPGQIADRMGRTEGSIHGLHHRGRRALRRELVRLGSAPCTRSARELAAA